MINLAVINLKNLIKGLIKIIIVTLIVAMIFKFIDIIKNQDILKKIEENVWAKEKEIIQSSASVFEDISNLEKKDLILESELSSFYSEEEIIEEELELGLLEENLEIKKKLDAKEEDNVGLRNLVTKVVNSNNKKDTYTNIYGTVKIKNES